MMALLQDARMDELLSSKSGTGLKWLRKANQFAQGFYSFGDDFWKIIGFENEKAGLLKAGIPLAEAEAMAAKRRRCFIIANLNQSPSHNGLLCCLAAGTSPGKLAVAVDAVVVVRPAIYHGQRQQER